MSRDCWEELNRIRFKVFSSASHETQQQKYILLLAVRITELCQDSCELIRKNRPASVPIIMRSALESYIDLRCIIDDANHISKMNESFKHFKEQVKPKDKVFDKFKSAGEVSTYNGFYSFLCRSSHGNIESLVRDHTIDGVISIGHNPPAQQIQQYTNQIIALAASAMIDALSFVDFPQDLIFEIQKIQKLASTGEYA